MTTCIVMTTCIDDYMYSQQITNPWRMCEGYGSRSVYDLSKCVCYGYCNTLGVLHDIILFVCGPDTKSSYSDFDLA